MRETTDMIEAFNRDHEAAGYDVEHDPVICAMREWISSGEFIYDRETKCRLRNGGVVGLLRLRPESLN